MNALQESVRFFTQETHILACMSVTCGRANEAYHAMGGVIDRQGTPLGEASLYDLASLTKLFTGLLALRLREEGLLDLAQPVTRYAPMFTRLGEVSVDRVLGFQVGLTTPARIDTQPDPEAGFAQLFGMHPGPAPDRPYSDMHSMVLKYVIEGAAGQDYVTALQQRILRPLGMENTFAHVPAERLKDCILYDGEHRIEKEKRILRTGIAPGTPHDPKARLLMQTGQVCGHAGMFASRQDMQRLCQGVLRGEIISRESLRFMAQNRTGRPLPGGGYVQFLGCQCYVKHPDQYFSEVPCYMSPEAVGLSGFTGNHLSIDPVTGAFALMLGNRVLDRLTVLIPAPGRCRQDYGLAPDGTGCIPWQDGCFVHSSVDYVHQKDVKLHGPIGEILRLPPFPGGNE